MNIERLLSKLKEFAEIEHKVLYLFCGDKERMGKIMSTTDAERAGLFFNMVIDDNINFPTVNRKALRIVAALLIFERTPMEQKVKERLEAEEREFNRIVEGIEKMLDSILSDPPPCDDPSCPVHGREAIAKVPDPLKEKSFNGIKFPIGFKPNKDYSVN